VSPTRKPQPDDPTAEQLPADQPIEDDPEVNNDLPEEPIDESPADEKGERGKSAEAHANAPGQQKKDERVDPNTYPDPENPPRTP
jgi:hypothetical protein